MSPPSLCSAGRMASMASRIPSSMLAMSSDMNTSNAQYRALYSWVATRIRSAASPRAGTLATPGQFAALLRRSAHGGVRPARSVEAVDVGAERAEVAGKIRIAALDVLAVVDRGLAVGDEPGEHERRARPHIGRPDRRARQPRDTPHDRVAALRSH